MNLQFLLKKLYASEIFKNFMKENSDAFLCSGFFVIDKTGKEGNKQHFDYYVPGIKKMFSFKIEEGINLLPIEMFGEEIPEKISINYDFDFNEIEKMIEARMVKEGIKSKIQKVFFSLQAKNERNFLVGTVFISMLGMIKINIDLKNMEITEFERKSFFDIMKVSKKK